MIPILYHQLQKKKKNVKSKEKSRASPGGSVIKNPPADAEDIRV